MTRRFLLSVVRSPLIYLAALLAGSIGYFNSASPYFGTIANLKSTGSASALFAIVAVGVTIALAAGAIDFSIAGNMALTGVIGAWFLPHVGSGFAIVIALAVGVGIGLVNGIVVTRFGVNPFIATLAMAGSLRGLAFVISGSSSAVNVNGGPLLTLGQQSVHGVPYTVIILFVVTALGYFVLRYLPFGRTLLAVGGNPEAARFAGMRVNALQISGYVIAALLAAGAGLLLAGRTGAALPQAASGQELLIFSAVLLGGTSLSGGRSSVFGSVLGIFFVNVLYTGLVLTQVSTHWEPIIQGVLLIVAVWLAQQRQEGRDPLWVIGRLTAVFQRRAEL
jgi:ribose/xylose/arabinose/galactoside ABC-type transport system permease subunit